MRRTVIVGAGSVAVAASFVLLLVRPTETPEPISPAAAWIASISNLGLTPIYPPSEDFQVGDILAVITEPPGSRRAPLSVRIARMDLRAEILEEQRLALRFAQTTVPAPGRPFREHSPWSEPASGPIPEASPEAASERIALSLAAFPGFAAEGTRRIGVSGGAAGWSLAGARAETEKDEIRIPVAETYGVSPVHALRRLIEYCAAVEAPAGGPGGAGARQAINPCRDEQLRLPLAFLFGENALLPRADGWVPALRTVVVTRVYLMREVQQMTSRGSERSATTRTPAAEGAPLPLEASGAADITNTTRSGIELNQVFQRPVVFAYQGVAMEPRRDTRP